MQQCSLASLVAGCAYKMQKPPLHFSLHLLPGTASEAHDLLCAPLSSSIIWGCQGWLKALLAAADDGAGKAYVGHIANKRTAARCLAGALGSLHHFNYASDLLQVPFCLAAYDSLYHEMQRRQCFRQRSSSRASGRMLLKTLYGMLLYNETHSCLQAILPRTVQPDAEVAGPCCEAVEGLLAGDAGGSVRLEALQLMADLIPVVVSAMPRHAC